MGAEPTIRLKAAFPPGLRTRFDGLTAACIPSGALVTDAVRYTRPENPLTLFKLMENSPCCEPGVMVRALVVGEAPKAGAAFSVKYVGIIMMNTETSRSATSADAMSIERNLRVE